MAQRIRSQRRGNGSLVWQSPSHRYRGPVRYPHGQITGTVVDFAHDPGRSAPLAHVQTDGGDTFYTIAAEGMKVGDRIADDDAIALGQVCRLGDITEGVAVYNIERRPGDGGQLARSSGSRGEIIFKEHKRVKVSLRSRKVIDLSPQCRATIGIAGGRGRTEKPFKKAGKKSIAEKRRGNKYPVQSANAMDPVDHPFGGAGKPGKPKTTRRSSPPGQKVGSIAARRTGKKKKK